MSGLSKLRETESTMAMVKRTAEFLKEQQKQGLEMAKKGAEYLKETSRRVSDSLPKLEEGYRGYHHKFHENIAVMVGGSCISVYCTYCYFFKNVEKEVSVLKMTLEEVEMKAVRVDKGLALSRAIATKKARELAQLKMETKKRAEEMEKEQVENKKRLEEMEKEQGERKKRTEELETEFDIYKEKVDKLTLEMADLKRGKEALKLAPPPMSSLRRLMTVTPIPPEHAAALVEMRQHQLHMQAWKKKMWMV